MELTSAFERLEKAIERISPGMHRYLSPGLTQEEIQALMTNRPYRLPDDVARLYQWHNGEGYDAPHNWHLAGTLEHFVSLQNGLLDEDGYALRRELLGYDFGGQIPAELDAPGYVVLFEDGCGDEIIVPCWNREVKTSRIFYMPKLFHVAVGYGSVVDMINTLATCYEEGVHYLKDGEFQTNFEKLYEVSRRLNPEAGHWRQE